MPDTGPSWNILDIARSITPKSGKAGWSATGPAGTTSGSGNPLLRGDAIPRGLFSALAGRFGRTPYTGGRVPPGSTVTYSNTGYYEPYRGSPRTHKKKVRSKRRVQKWVDTRAVWEKMLDWATNPSTWKGQAVDTRPMREQSPEQQAKFRDYMAGQMIRAGADIAITAGSSRVRLNTPTLKPAPTMRTYSRGPTPMDPIEVPALPKVKEPRLPAVYPGYAPPRPGTPATVDPLEEVTVTAPRVGRISAPLSDDRWSTADAIADELTEVKVSATRVGSAANQVGTGPGRANASTSPARSAGTVTQPASGAGKTGTSAPVARPGVGSFVLPFDPLLREIVGKLSSRPPNARQARQRLGAAIVSPGRAVVSQLAPDVSPYAFGYAARGGRTVTRTDECECEKKQRKPRKPRTVCYRGSYKETAKGLSKRRLEQVPC